MASAKNPGDNSKPVKLALSIIKADKKNLQPRADMDDDHMQRMARSYIEGEDIPPPVHVFYDGKFYWLVDGFHRYFAMWSIRHMGAKFQHIKAIVHEGTKEEAIAYAAQANLDNRSKPMGDADRKKAMWMLMGLLEWRSKSANAFGKIFGLSHGTAKRYWVAFFSENNLPVPLVATASDGRNRSTRRGVPIVPGSPSIRTGKDGHTSATIRGKNIGFGRNPDPEKIADKIRKHIEYTDFNIKKYENLRWISSLLLTHHIKSESFFSMSELKRHPGIFAHKAGGVIFTCESFRNPANAVAAIGRAVCIRAMLCVSRVVILCPVKDGPPEILELGRKMGIEFMTIEDFIASLKPSEPTPDEAPPDA
jgi:hypothetical protein